MTIEEIYSPFLYSIRYANNEQNEYDRLFENWSDVDFVLSFFKENEKLLQSRIWVEVKVPELAARQVLKEADELYDLLEELAENAKQNKIPNLDDHFISLGGRYKYEITYEPYKSYGTKSPSFLRLYATKMGSNTYLITGGGIKLAKTIQESPDLQTHVLQNIDKVRRWLKMKEF